MRVLVAALLFSIVAASGRNKRPIRPTVPPAPTISPLAEFLYGLTGSKKSLALEKCMTTHVPMSFLAGEGLPSRPESQPVESFMLRVLTEARPSLWPLVHCLAVDGLLLPERFTKVAPRLFLSAIASVGDSNAQDPLALIKHLATLPLALLGSTSDGRTALHVAFDRGKTAAEGVLLAALSESGASSHYIKTLRNISLALSSGGSADDGAAAARGKAAGKGLASVVSQSLIKARVAVEDARVGATVIVHPSGDADAEGEEEEEAALLAGASRASVGLRDASLPVGRTLRAADLDGFLAELSAGVVRTLLPLLSAAGGGAGGVGRGALPLHLQLLTKRDAIGRTPLHAAAATGDAASVRVICDALVAALLEGSAVLSPSASGPEPPTAAAAAASIPWLQDAFGYTPRELALLQGGHASRAVARALESCEGRVAQAAAAAAGADGDAAFDGPRHAAPFNSGVQPGFRTVNVSSPYASSTRSHPPSQDAGTAATSKNHAAASEGARWPRPPAEPRSLRAAVAALDASEAPHSCEFDVVDVSSCARAAEEAEACLEALLPRQTFLRDYAIPGRPVLVRGAALSWPIMGSWGGPQDAASALGALAVNFSAAEIPNARQWGLRATGRIPAADYLAITAGLTDANCSGTAAAPLPALCASLRAPPNTPARAAGGSTALPWPRAPLLYSGDLTPAEPAHVDVVDSLTVIPWLLRGNLPLWDPASEAAGAGDAERSTPLVSMEPLPPDLSVTVAVPGAGVPMRPTPGGASTLDVAVVGSRRWALLPPDRAEHSTVPALLYAAHVLPSPGGSRRGSQQQPPLRCEQGAGDALFLPRRWSAAWLALDSGAGYEVRFASPLDRY